VHYPVLATDSEQERNTTPHQLWIPAASSYTFSPIPESASHPVATVLYQTIEIKKSSVGIQPGLVHILTLRDAQQQLELKITLSQDELNQLKQQLPQ